MIDLSGFQTSPLVGFVMLVERGGCSFATKVLNAMSMASNK